MDLFDGLFLYEAVLLVLGALFFIWLTLLVEVRSVCGKPCRPLLVFFAVPISMIAFPNWQKIEFQTGSVALEQTTARLLADPANRELRADLAKQVKFLSRRPTSDPAVKAHIAAAESALAAKLP